MKRFICKIISIADFLLFYLKEIVLSNIKVAYDVLTPKDLMEPAIVEVSTEGLGEWQLFAVANLISMTPGTLSLDISEDRNTLWVHCMYAGEPGQIAKELEDNYIKRITHVC